MRADLISFLLRRKEGTRAVRRGKDGGHGRSDRTETSTLPMLRNGPFPPPQEEGFGRA